MKWKAIVFGALIPCYFMVTERKTCAQNGAPENASVNHAHVLVQHKEHVCANAPEHRQFDFWIGEWEVRNSEGQAGAGQAVATSSIQRIIDSCVVYENYSEGDEFTGKSFNFYDPTLRKWRQTWVDSTSRVSEFTGEYKDGAMRFEGESHLPNGLMVLRHMTLFNLGPERVRQLSEASTDGGKTWRVTYDFTYVRKK